MYYTKAEIKQQDGKILGVASTAVQDRQGEVVSVDGWDLKNFKKAPRLLWAHNHTEPAIGKVTKTWYEGTGKSKRLMFEAIFQEVTEMGRAIKQLVKDGFINTFSVGFVPLEIDGNTITKQELLEISVVNVPANPDAMMLAYKSLKSANVDDEIIEKVIDKSKLEPDESSPPEEDTEIEELKSKIASLEDQVAVAVKGLTYLAPQRSKRVTEQRLTMVKAIAKAADNLVVKPQNKTVITAKVIKRSSEMLIREMKGDLNGSTQRTQRKASSRNAH